MSSVGPGGTIQSVNDSQEGLFSSLVWMRDHKAETVAMVAPILHHVSATALSKAYDLEMPAMAFDGPFDPQGVEVLKESFVELGIPNNKQKDDQLLTARFLSIKTVTRRQNFGAKNHAADAGGHTHLRCSKRAVVAVSYITATFFRRRMQRKPDCEGEILGRSLDGRDSATILPTAPQNREPRDVK